MTCFVMTIPDVDSNQEQKIIQWCERRCSEFDTYDVTDDDNKLVECRVGGVLLEEPQSLKHLQLQMGHNLKNWGVKRRSWSRGWLRIVSRLEMSEYLQQPQRMELARRSWNNMFSCYIRRERERRAKVEKEAKLQRMVDILASKQKNAFMALANFARNVKEVIKEKRELRRKALNLERYGRPLNVRNYTSEELDSNEPRSVLKKRRLETWTKMQLDMDRRHEQAELEKEQERKWAERKQARAE